MERLFSGYEVMFTGEGLKIGVNTWLFSTLQCNWLCLGINKLLLKYLKAHFACKIVRVNKNSIEHTRTSLNV